MRESTPFGLWVGLCVLLASACNRTEEPHSSGDAQAAPAPPTPAPMTEKSAPNSKAKCVIPMAAEPPRRAPNALHCPPDPQGSGELPHGYVVFTEAPGSPRL